MDNCMCIIEDISRGTPFFEMHRDYWHIVSKYLNGDVNRQRPDSYWEKVVEEAGTFTKKYSGKYSQQLMLTFLDELERRDKTERSIAKQKAIQNNRVPA